MCTQHWINICKLICNQNITQNRYGCSDKSNQTLINILNSLVFSKRCYPFCKVDIVSNPKTDILQQHPAPKTPSKSCPTFLQTPRAMTEKGAFYFDRQLLHKVPLLFWFLYVDFVRFIHELDCNGLY